MFKTIAIALITLFAFGCASQAKPTPTHYWENPQSVSETKYRTDEHRCNEMASSDESGQYPADSLSFEHYKTCMIEKGYVLRTY